MAAGLLATLAQKRPVGFTSEGIHRLEPVDEVLPRLHNAELDLQRVAGDETGRVIITIECHSCFERLLPTIDSYRDAWSDVG